MKIETVKIQTYNGKFSGYKVNENTFYPKENCELIKQWLSEGNTHEPEFTEEELQITSINKQIQEAKAYLASTDFYMTVDKYSELDEARKVELTTKRAEAREVINTLEAELTIIGAE